MQKFGHLWSTLLSYGLMKLKINGTVLEKTGIGIDMFGEKKGVDFHEKNTSVAQGWIDHTGLCCTQWHGEHFTGKGKKVIYQQILAANITPSG